MRKVLPKKEIMELNLSSSIVQQSTWVLLLDLSAKSDAQFSKARSIRGKNKEEKRENLGGLITQTESP